MEPQLATRSGQVWPLRGEQPIKIGRSNQNEIQVLDRMASRYHAAVRPGADGWTLVDQNSQLGTLVNGIRLTAPRLLRDGDVIRIGETELTYADGRLAGSEGSAAVPSFRQPDLEEQLAPFRRLPERATMEIVFDSLLDIAIKTARAERGFVMLAEDERSLEVKAARAAGGVPLPGKAFSTSRTIPQEVFETGNERFVTNLMEGDDRLNHQETISFDIRNVFCLPLKTEKAQRPFGVVYLDSRERGALLSQEVRSQLRRIADAGADAIETMRARIAADAVRLRSWAKP